MTRPGRIAFVLVIVLLFLAGPSLVRFYTDWLWFGEVGYQQVYATMLRTQGTLFTAAFVIAIGWFILNFRVALSSIGNLRPVFTTREGVEVTLPSGKQLRGLATGAAALLSMIIGLYVAGRWEIWLTWRNGVPFNVADPILGRDVGFYVYSLPFLQLLRGMGQAFVVLAALTSGGLYLMSGSLSTGFPSRMSMTPSARRHLSLLAAAFCCCSHGRVAAPHRTSRGNLRSVAWPATRTYGRMPAALFRSRRRHRCRARADARSIRTSHPRGDRTVCAGLDRRRVAARCSISVTPNEQVRETPPSGTYRCHDASLSLDGRGAAFSDTRCSPATHRRNADARERASVDHAPLLEPSDRFRRSGRARLRVRDSDRYQINGALRRVMLPRASCFNDLPARTWVNSDQPSRAGCLTLGPVNQVTSEGLPVLFVRNLPPETIPDLKIDEPSLYFGELSNDYVIVRTKTPEFHYPRGDDNETTRYSGKGGVPIGTLWRKLMFALRFGSYQMVLSDDIGAESRILFNRNIRERVERIAPFLALDRDPYLVLASGRLYWLVDAYTTSNRYPYSTPAGPLNYIRNSVKFVIDAYDGTTTAYLSDAKDPIAATFARIFPNMFKPLSDMPAAIRVHVRYPEDIFAIQAQVFSTYHMTQPAVYYNREDQWEIPSVDDGNERIAMQPYYTIMRLPGEKEAEFIQMLPFTPRRRDNLAAWLVARSDGDHYGRLGVFEFPKQKLVFGPRQVVARIAQDQVISPQITLWNQQGSQVIWGTLMVIPIEESLIYVRPLYLRTSGGKITELTRVIVAYQSKIVMAETELSATCYNMLSHSQRL
jgi:uncharacterized membrane protein (UPF0182 family)